MNIIQCKLCKKPFHSVGGKICPECLDQIEKDYMTIRNYLYDNPDESNVETIAENTGVSRAIVIYLIESGRLFAKGSAGEEGKCQICGKRIFSGKICEGCNSILTAGIKEAPNKNVFESKKSDSYAKMHINRDR